MIVSLTHLKNPMATPKRMYGHAYIYDYLCLVIFNVSKT